jgi:hypothetical protein
MSSVRQLCDGALAAMGRSDEGALHLCCGGLMSRRVRLAFDDLEAVCALAMVLSGGHETTSSQECGTACARFAQLLCNFVGRAASPQHQLALGREMYAARKASSSGTPELYAALALARALMSCQRDLLQARRRRRARALGLAHRRVRRPGVGHVGVGHTAMPIYYGTPPTVYHLPNATKEMPQCRSIQQCGEASDGRVV